MPSPKCCNQLLSQPFPDRCTIEPNDAALGNPVPDYTGEPLAKNVPCRIISTGGDETYRGRQLEAKIDYVVEMRFIRGVLPTMRLRITTGIYKDRILNIGYVCPMQKPGSPPILSLKCTELVPV